MAGDAIRLTVALPAGYESATLAPLDLSQTPQLKIEQWNVAGPHGQAASLVWACFAGDPDGWSADATELARGKLAEIASGTLVRLGSLDAGLHATQTKGGAVLEQILESVSRQSRARTFLAFSEYSPHVHGCFAACSGGSECAAAIDGATIEGTLASTPPPGLGLRMLGAAVHHPRAAVVTLFGVLFVAAALAVATRPRNRRIGRF